MPELVTKRFRARRTPFYRAAAEPLLETYLYPTPNTMLGITKKYFFVGRGGGERKKISKLLKKRKVVQFTLLFSMLLTLWKEFSMV